MRRLGLADAVIVREKELAIEDYLQIADVGLYTSNAESFCLSILEAMCFGCPSVSPGVGGIPEVVDDNESGLLVPPRNAAALAAALESLIDDEPRRRARWAGPPRRARAHGSRRRSSCHATKRSTAGSAGTLDRLRRCGDESRREATIKTPRSVRVALLAVVTAALPTTPPAQPAPPSLAKELAATFQRASTEILDVAEAMPAEKYGYRPTPEISGFGEQLVHVAGIAQRVFDSAKGTKTDVAHHGPMAKPEVIGLLKKTFQSAQEQSRR